MLDCLVVGDSIAVGLAQAAPYCAVAAQSGITSARWVERFASSLPPASTVVISLGTNDPIQTPPTNGALWRVRASVSAGNVVWILPSAELRPNAHSQVNAVASKYGDYVVPVRPDYLSPDRIHMDRPGYRRLMSWLFGK
jgi:lysophospholipase L1-like esterase